MVAVFNFLFEWNEFVFDNTFISVSAMKTIPFGLNDFVNNYGIRQLGYDFCNRHSNCTSHPDRLLLSKQAGNRGHDRQCSQELIL